MGVKGDCCVRSCCLRSTDRIIESDPEGPLVRLSGPLAVFRGVLVVWETRSVPRSKDSIGGRILWKHGTEGRLFLLVIQQDQPRICK
jgi:hypothetical protein